MLKATLARSALERQMSRPEFASTMRWVGAGWVCVPCGRQHTSVLVLRCRVKECVTGGVLCREVRFW